MWLVEQFAAFHAQSLEAAKKKIPVTKIPSPAPTPPGSGTTSQEKIVLWDFRVNQVLIGSFIGAGDDIALAGTDLRIGTWKFQTEPGQIFHVPAWPVLDVPAGSFLGFAGEIPSDGSMYMLQYGGLDEKKNILMKVFKK